jgi:hypothetical protein
LKYRGETNELISSTRKGAALNFDKPELLQDLLTRDGIQVNIGTPEEQSFSNSLGQHWVERNYMNMK